MYIVDTNVLSEARRRSAQALTWLRSVDSSLVFLSVVTLGEIMKGVVLKQRTDPRASSVLQNWLEQLRLDHADRVLPITDRIALEWGRLAAKRSRSVPDGLIAATALVHGKTVVTRNSADFKDANVPVINPWRL
jgi:predicted nucleic acid-binding protein